MGAPGSHLDQGQAREARTRTESSDVSIPRQGHCAVTRVERQAQYFWRCNETTTESPAKNRPRTAPGGQSLRRWRKRAEGRQRGS